MIDPGGTRRIVGVTEPDYLPTLAILDPRLEKQFNPGGSKAVHLIVDGFNLINTNTPTNSDYQWESGKVTGIPASFRFRATAKFTF